MTYQEAAAWLLTQDDILILTHVRPDGDTIGCAAGLCHALREQGKTAHVLPNPETTNLFSDYLQGLLAPAFFAPKCVVAVDMAAKSLFPENALKYLEAGVDLAIDHHSSQEFYAKETCLDSGRAACGELVYDLIAQWGPVSAAAALPLYVAVSTDTGCFLYGNTTGDTHRVAGALLDMDIPWRQANHRHFRTKSLTRLKLEGLLADGMQVLDGGETAIISIPCAMLEELGASEEDMDNIASFAGSVEGVSTGITLRELSPDVWKLSLRTDPLKLNASAVCALLAGGGHPAAAGAIISGTLPQVTDRVVASIRKVQANPL